MIKSDIIAKPNRNRYYFETIDLVLIALFSALGGVFSVFVGNLTRTIFSSSLFGLGQLFSGFHIFWYVIVYYLSGRKFGTVTLTGIIKGIVEVYVGSTLSITVVMISVGGAFLFDLLAIFFFKLISHERGRTISIIISAGLSSSFNVLVLWNMLLLGIDKNGLPNIWIIALVVFSFVSGVIFAGFLGQEIAKYFLRSGLLNWRKLKEE
ncbi:ECF transporter S component [Candidatus Hodarchaeum mangrovi]